MSNSIIQCHHVLLVQVFQNETIIFYDILEIVQMLKGTREKNLTCLDYDCNEGDSIFRNSSEFYDEDKYNNIRHCIIRL